MTPPASHPGLGQPVLPPVVARVVRDVLLILGLGLAVALLRSAAVGADPGGGALPAAPERPLVGERAAAPSIPALLDEVLAPVRDLVPPPSTGSRASAPSRTPDDPAGLAGASPAPDAVAPPSTPSAPPTPPPTAEAAPAELGELLVPVADLLDAVTAPLVPVVAAALEPLRPILDLVVPTLLPGVTEAVPPLAAPLVPSAPQEPGLGASLAGGTVVVAPVPAPVPAPIPGPSPVSPPSIPPVPAPVVHSQSDADAGGLSPPVDDLPSGRVGGALGPPAGAAPTFSAIAVLSLIEIPAVVAAGLAVPSCTDGTSVTCPRPGFSPD